MVQAFQAIRPGRSCALLLLALLAACATYRAQPLPRRPDNPIVTSKGVRASAAILVHYDESRAVLGEDLKSKGIVPVDLWIHNGRSKPIRLDSAHTRLIIRERGVLDLTDQAAARKKAKKSVLGAAGWAAVMSGPALPLAVAASFLQIREVNDKIRKDYEAKAFPVNDPIPPRGQARGLLFFEVPKKYLKKTGPADFGVAVVTRESATGNAQKFEFGVPRSRASQPLSAGKPFWKVP